MIGVFFQSMAQAYRSSENQSCPNRSQTSDLPITSLNAELQETCGSLAIKLGSRDLFYMYIQQFQTVCFPFVITGWLNQALLVIIK